MEIMIYSSSDYDANELAESLTEAGYYVRSVNVNDGESVYNLDSE